MSATPLHTIAVFPDNLPPTNNRVVRTRYEVQRYCLQAWSLLRSLPPDTEVPGWALPGQKRKVGVYTNSVVFTPEQSCSMSAQAVISAQPDLIHAYIVSARIVPRPGAADPDYDDECLAIMAMINDHSDLTRGEAYEQNLARDHVDFPDEPLISAKRYTLHRWFDETYMYRRAGAPISFAMFKRLRQECFELRRVAIARVVHKWYADNSESLSEDQAVAYQAQFPAVVTEDERPPAKRQMLGQFTVEEKAAKAAESAASLATVNAVLAKMGRGDTTFAQERVQHLDSTSVCSADPTLASPHIHYTATSSWWFTNDCISGGYHSGHCRARLHERPRSDYGHDVTSQLVGGFMNGRHDTPGCMLQYVEPIWQPSVLVIDSMLGDERIQEDASK